jgi:hypothetical protein
MTSRDVNAHDGADRAGHDTTETSRQWLRPATARLSLRVVVVVVAALAPATPAAAAMTLAGNPSATDAATVELDATVEAFFAWDANRPADGVIGGRIFDPRHGELALSTVMLGLSARRERSRASLKLWRGYTPAVIWSAEPAGPVDWSLLREANAGVRVADGAWLEAGLFGSPIGLESVFARDNWLWSGALLNVAMPFEVAGARLSYALGASATAEVGLYGGWTRLRASNIPSTVIARVFGEASWGLWQVLVSSAPTRPDLSMVGTGRVRGWLVDAFASGEVSERVELATQLNAGTERWSVQSDPSRSAVWAAANVWARLRLTPALRLAARGGVFWQGGDHDLVKVSGGVVEMGRLWWPTGRLVEGAVALEWRAAPDLMLRAEGRFDHAADAAFLVRDDALSTARQTVSLGLCWTL